MKGFLVLSVALLVPSVAYYQKQHFEGVLQERLRLEVLGVLKEGGVREAVVTMEWMDVSLGGRVASLQDRIALQGRVEEVRGVRLARQGNRLEVLGWVEVARRGGLWEARGLVPVDFGMGLPGAVDQGEPWDAGLERAGAVEAPVGALEWGRFLNLYFAGSGDRSVRLQDGLLVLSGEATGGTRADWLAEASKLLDKEQVREEFALRPSVYHFAGYEPETLREGKETARLQETLKTLGVDFAEGSAEVTEEGGARIAAVAQAILRSEEQARFVVGATGEGSEEAALAMRRIKAVVALLGEYGVAESQLIREVFGGAAGGRSGDRVEVLLK